MRRFNTFAPHKKSEGGKSERFVGTHALPFAGIDVNAVGIEKLYYLPSFVTLEAISVIKDFVW